MQGGQSYQYVDKRTFQMLERSLELSEWGIIYMNMYVIYGVKKMEVCIYDTMYWSLISTRSTQIYRQTHTHIAS